MKPKDIAEAKNPDLRSSLAALQRASMLARKVAIQTDTDLVIVRDGRLVGIDAMSLRQQAEEKNSPGS